MLLLLLLLGGGRREAVLLLLGSFESFFFDLSDLKGGGGVEAELLRVCLRVCEIAR